MLNTNQPRRVRKNGPSEITLRCKMLNNKGLHTSRIEATNMYKFYCSFLSYNPVIYGVS